MRRSSLSATIVRIVVAATALTACADWPPFQTEAIAHFTKYRAELERLADAVASDHLDHVYSSELDDLVVMKEPMPPHLVEKYRGLFADVPDVSAIFRGGNVIRFDLGQTYSIGSTHYLFRYVRGTPYPSIPPCVTVKKPGSEGLCSIPIEDDWLFVYQWYSTPAEPAS